MANWPSRVASAAAGARYRALALMLVSLTVLSALLMIVLGGHLYAGLKRGGYVAGHPVSVSEPSSPFPMNGLTAPDSESAMALAIATGESVEDVSQRQASVEIFAEPNGTWQMRQWLAPVWVLTEGEGDSAADWAPLELELVAAGNGILSPRAYPTRLAFAERAEAGEPLVEWDLPGTDVNLSLLAPAQVGEPVVEGARVRYLSVHPGVDLVFDVRPSGFEQFFIVHDRGALESLGFDLAIDYAVTNGALVQVDEVFELRDGAGQTVGWIPPAFGWDATQDPFTTTPVLAEWAVEGENPNTIVSDQLAVTVPLEWRSEPRGPATTVTITVPTSWVDDEAATFPLIIDPIPYSPYFSWDAHIRTDHPNNNYSTGTELFVGKDPTYGPIYRSLLNVPTAGLAGKDLISANFYLWNSWSATCTQVPWTAFWFDAFSSGSTFNNLPAQRGAGVTSTHTRGHTSGSAPYCSQNWAWVDITTMARAWTSEPASYQGVLIKAGDETAQQWKRFYSVDSSSANKPHLSIWYNQAPHAPSGLTYTPAVLGTRATVSATVTDPDGAYYSLRALFNIERRPIGSQEPWQVVLDQAEGSLVAHGELSTRAVDLAGGFEYRMRAWAQDTRIMSTVPSGYVSFVISSTSTFQDFPTSDDDDV